MAPIPEQPTFAVRLLAARNDPSGNDCFQLFEGCRRYLLLIARQRWPIDLQAKESPSDLVQQTFVKVYDEFRSFTGNSQAEWLGWVRSILLNELQNLIKDYHQDKRNASREFVAGSDGSGPAPWDGMPARTRRLVRSCSRQNK